MQTERVTFLTTPDHKAALASRAAAQGVSIGEYIRRRTDDQDDLTAAEEAELGMLVAQVNDAIPQMIAVLDGMIEDLQQTNRHVQATLYQLDRPA